MRSGLHPEIRTKKRVILLLAIVRVPCVTSTCASFACASCLHLNNISPIFHGLAESMGERSDIDEICTMHGFQAGLLKSLLRSSSVLHVPSPPETPQETFFCRSSSIFMPEDTSDLPKYRSTRSVWRPSSPYRR